MCAFMPKNHCWPLLALVHLRIALAAGVLGRARRRNQRGIDHRAAAQHQALGAQQQVDCRQNPLSQLVLLQHMTEAQDGALVGHSLIPAAQARKGAKQWHVMQGFFHRRVAQREPLQHETNAQQRLDGERRPSALALRHEKGDLHHQVGPRYHAVHLFEELTAARALRRSPQSKAALLHRLNDLRQSPRCQAHAHMIYADLP